MTMNINLTPQLESLVKQKVASGLYNSASEIMREALRLMEEQDCMRAVKLEQLHQNMALTAVSPRYGMTTKSCEKDELGGMHEKPLVKVLNCPGGLSDLAYAALQNNVFTIKI